MPPLAGLRTAAKRECGREARMRPRSANVAASTSLRLLAMLTVLFK
jgi:hypothetical protein